MKPSLFEIGEDASLVHRMITAGILAGPLEHAATSRKDGPRLLLCMARFAPAFAKQAFGVDSQAVTFVQPGDVVRPVDPATQAHLVVARVKEIVGRYAHECGKGTHTPRPLSLKESLFGGRA